MAETWLFGASWQKFIKALLLYEMVHVILVIWGIFWQEKLK